MAIIKVRTPDGIQQVRIAGDTPTPEEEQAIVSAFSPRPSRRRAEIDLATATSEEITDYQNKMYALGKDPATGEQLSTEEFVEKYKELGVDYRTGLDDVAGFSRFQFGRMETDEEKAAYLTDKVGAEGFRQDALGRFILTKEGRSRLGMEEGKELAIDEEGLSFGDVKEFFGTSGLPIAAGITAGILTGGLGFIPGMLAVGAASAGGKILDEAIELAEGYQRQSFGEVSRDVAFEGVFGMAGEGIGRGISKALGRLIKGPGGAENEALRQQARELLDRGFQPTVAGATSEEFRPILNRLQAVYEGVFPNAKAAKNNLSIIMDDLSKIRGVNPQAIRELGEVVNRDIDSFFATQDDLLATAQRNMDQSIRGEINTIISKLDKDEFVPKELAEKIFQRKQIFDEDVDALYTASSEALRGAKIIPTEGIKAALKELQEASIADVESTKFARWISELEDPFTTPAQANKLRRALTEASYNPSLVNDASVASLGRLKAAVNESMHNATVSLSVAAKRKPLLPDGSKLIGIVREDGTPITFKEASDGLHLLHRANELYRTGIKHFDNVVAKDIIAQARKGQLNSKYIFEQIIEKDNPEAFNQLMQAIRGVPSLVRDIGEGQAILKSQTIAGRTPQQLMEDISVLDPKSSIRRTYEGMVREAEEKALEIATLRGTGAEAAESLRQQLAREYLKRVTDNSMMIDRQTGQKVLDPIKLAVNLKEKGTTVNRMLGSDLKTVDDIITVIEKSGAKIAPSVMESINSKPLAQALKDINKAVAQREAVSKESVLNVLRATDNPDAIAEAVFRSPRSISIATKALAPETMEQVRDAAMGRILKQIGYATDEAGVPRLTNDFMNSFKSGQMGEKLQTVLKAYGDDTINAMFGEGSAKALNTLASDMVKVSNQSLAGKGGLAAATIAISLGLVGMITNPLATIPTAAGFFIMSRALRNPTVLRGIMSSRNPNTVKQFLNGKLLTDNPIQQGLQTILALKGQATIQGGRLLETQTEEEARPYIEEARREIEPQLRQEFENLRSTIQAPTVQAPSPASQAGQINPILVPDPATRATFGNQ